MAKIVGGGTPSTKVSNYWDGEIDWYTPSEIGDRTYLKQSEKKITSSGLDNSSAQLLPVGTVLFTSRAGIGKTAILKKTSTTNQGFQSIVPNLKLLKSYYIFSLTSKLKKYGEINGAGSTFIEVSGKQMAKMDLMLPSLKEQDDISDLLKTADKIIILSRKKLTMYESLKKYLLQNLFPSDGEKIPNVRFADFSGDWEQHKLGKITNIFDGTHQTPSYTKEGVMFLSVEDIRTLHSKKFISEMDFKKDFKISPKASDILMTRIGDVGTTNVVNYNGNIAYYVSLALLQKKDTDSLFLNYCISSPAVQREIWKRTLQVAFPRKINKNEIKKIPINISKKEEQIKIGKIFSKIDFCLYTAKKQLSLYKNMKKYYTQKLLV
ncbi:restriction endonuclease subunit S [Companilactobacillus zhachilii]|uniref:restriction endonuclease subunit S n=1 Tax=Companilactobacillus zhachilii TaxID=2304606 RepID=UPI00142235E4|nr:restriction endonuclease subunit S [Companilactobacillus zhachilii]